MNHEQHVLERRLKALRELPWFLPAETVMEVTTGDLDRLAEASWSDSAYRWVLRASGSGPH